MKDTTLIYWLPLIFFIVVLGIVIFGEGGTKANYDLFARCLTEKGFVMYGAKWCSHCQNEKQAFGDSFKHISYVECPDDPSQCLERGINGYPTWISDAGKRLEGEQGLEKLSQESGCLLEVKNRNTQ